MTDFWNVFKQIWLFCINKLPLYFHTINHKRDENLKSNCPYWEDIKFIWKAIFCFFLYKFWLHLMDKHNRLGSVTLEINASFQFLFSSLTKRTTMESQETQHLRVNDSYWKEKITDKMWHGVLWIQCNLTMSCTDERSMDYEEVDIELNV